MFSRLQERKQGPSWNAGLRSPLPNSPRYPAEEMHFEVWMVLTALSFHVMPKIFQSSPLWAALLFTFRKAQPPLFISGVRSRIICEEKGKCYIPGGGGRKWPVCAQELDQIDPFWAFERS